MHNGSPHTVYTETVLAVGRLVCTADKGDCCVGPHSVGLACLHMEDGTPHATNTSCTAHTYTPKLVVHHPDIKPRNCLQGFYQLWKFVKRL